MAKWKITSHDRSGRTTGTPEIEAGSDQEARTAADRVESESETGAAFTTIAKESSAWGFVTQPRK